MARYRASDSRREQFRRYLEKTGVLDTLTSALVALYEENDKPSNPLDFLKGHLGLSGPTPSEMEKLRVEIVGLQQQYERVLEENRALKNRFEPAQEGGATQPS